MPRLIDEAGNRYGRLLVIEVGGRRRTVPLWRCLCDCGKEVLSEGAALRSGRHRSCGCLKKDGGKQRLTTHGLGRIPEAAIWNSMKQRCSNPNTLGYANYGARGVKVCERWRESLTNFLEDMGRRPSPLHSVDRKDNDGDYEPSNCRWATLVEQHSNTRRNVFVLHEDEEITVAEWARRHGVHVQTAWGRYRRGEIPRSETR